MYALKTTRPGPVPGVLLDPPWDRTSPGSCFFGTRLGPGPPRNI